MSNLGHDGIPREFDGAWRRNLAPCTVEARIEGAESELQLQ